MITLCRSNPNNVEHSWFEENVCSNKNSIFSGLAMLFLFTVIFTMIKKKFGKAKKANNKPLAKNN